jgi:hypothetical protein
MGDVDQGADRRRGGDAGADGARDLSARHADDAIYGKVVYALDEKASADPALLRSLQEGAATLKSKKFDTLDETGQAAVLKEIETSAPFQAVRGECVTGIYNNPDVWKVLGYEGPSAELGGYINRGFSDIDWLQDA